MMYWFVSHVRRGVAASITGADPTGRAIANVVVRAEVAEKDGATRTKDHEHALTLYGPGDVGGIDPNQIVRMTPAVSDIDAEPNYLASVEFVHPDLPWMFSPVPEEMGHVRPWIALVVVEEPGTARVVPLAGSPNPVLVASGSELPDPSEVWAWAHVQVLSETKEAIPGLLANPQPSNVRSRLLSARHLEANRRYVACVVPTFDAGRRAGLDLGGSGGVAAAWRAQDATVTLPVYHHWRFRTGPSGDFETLASKLRRADTAALEAVGHRDVLVDAASSRLLPPDVVSTFDPIVVRVATAITKPDVTGSAVGAGPLSPVSPAPHASRDTIVARLVEVLDRGEVQRQAGSDRPVVGPPLYGQWAAEARAVGTALGGPTSPPWLAELNLDPETRAAAGAGTAAIQTDQEALMATAWDQLDAVVAANRRQRWGQLFLHAGASLHARRLVDRPFGAALVVARPAMTRVAMGDRTVSEAMSESPMPITLLSTTFARVARRSATLGPRSDRSSGAVVDAVAAPLLTGTMHAGSTRFTARPARLPLTEIAGLLKQAGAARVAEVTGFDVDQHLVQVVALPERLRVLDAAFLVEPPMVAREHTTIPQGAVVNESLEAAFGEVIRQALLTGTNGVDPNLHLSSFASSKRRTVLHGDNLGSVGALRFAGLSQIGGAQFGESLIEHGQIGGIAGAQMTNAHLGAALVKKVHPGQFDVAKAEGVHIDEALVQNLHAGGFGVAEAEGVHLDEALVQNLHAGGFGVAEAEGVHLDEALVQEVDFGGLIAAQGEGVHLDQTPSIAMSLAVFAELANVDRDLLAAGQVIDLSEQAFAVLADQADAGMLVGVDRAGLEAAVRIDRNPVGTMVLQKMVDASIIDAAQLSISARVSALVGEAEQFVSVATLAPPAALAALDPVRLAGVIDTIGSAALRRPPAERLVAPTFTTFEMSAVTSAVVDGLNATTQYTKMLSWMLPLESPAPSRRSPQRRSPSHPIMASPRFTDPFVDRLRTVDRDWVLGNAAALPVDSVAILAENRRFVESVLAGANHEFARELLWRRYPTDQMGTCFARFWPTVPEASGAAPPDDIADMAVWGGGLGEHPARAIEDAAAIVVIRGDLLRRYPETLVSAVFGRSVAAQPDPTFEMDAAVAPVKELFRGFLPTDITYVALAISAHDLLAVDGEKGWYISLAQPFELPRFGADEGVRGTARVEDPTDINDLSWDRLESDGLLDPVTRHIHPTRTVAQPRPELLGSWGPAVTSGTVAASLVQLPFQVLLRATDYLSTQ